MLKNNSVSIYLLKKDYGFRQEKVSKDYRKPKR